MSCCITLDGLALGGPSFPNHALTFPVSFPSLPPPIIPAHFSFGGLLRSICNELIRRAADYVQPTAARGFSAALAEQLQEVLLLCAKFRGVYLDARDRADVWAKETESERLAAALSTTTGRRAVKVSDLPTARETRKRRGMLAVDANLAAAAEASNARKGLYAWPDRSDGPFRRFNAFMDRCNDVLDLTYCVLHIAALRNVVIGGPRGGHFTAGVRQVYDDFQPPLRHFNSLRLNLLEVDTDVTDFNAAFFELRLNVKRLERRMVDILRQAYANTRTLGEQVKLASMVSDLARRHTVASGLRPCHQAIVEGVLANTEEALRTLVSLPFLPEDLRATIVPPSGQPASASASVAGEAAMLKSGVVRGQPSARPPSRPPPTPASAGPSSANNATSPMRLRASRAGSPSPRSGGRGVPPAKSSGKSQSGFHRGQVSRRASITAPITFDPTRPPGPELIGGLPPLPSHVTILRQVRGRAEALHHALQFLPPDIVAGVDGEREAALFRRLERCTQQAEERLVKNWVKRMVSVCKDALHRPLLRLAEEEAADVVEPPSTAVSPTRLPPAAMGGGAAAGRRPTESGSPSPEQGADVKAEPQLQLPAVVLNLDPVVMRVAKEVGYLLQLGIELPPELTGLQRESHRLHVTVNTLARILQVYDSLRNDLLPEEQPLLAERFSPVLEMIQRGLWDYTFRTGGTEDYLTELYAGVVEAFESRIHTIQECHSAIRDISSEWRTWKLPLSVFCNADRPFAEHEFTVGWLRRPLPRSDQGRFSRWGTCSRQC